MEHQETTLVILRVVNAHTSLIWSVSKLFWSSFGYHTNSDNSDSQQQPTVSYGQTSKALPGASEPRREKTTTTGIYA